MAVRSTRRVPYVNPLAQTWISASPGSSEAIANFHKKMPGFEPTPLVAVDKLAAEIGVKAVYVKDESSRCGLPSFKILGASWAAFRAIIEKTKLPIDTDFATLRKSVKAAAITLAAATEGNHGRAVARVASILETSSKIFVPRCLHKATIALLESEAATVVLVDGDYDEAVRMARQEADRYGAILVQDTAFDGYEEIPKWVVEGYSTMMAEIDVQLMGKAPDLVIAPVGVGSFAHAVVSHYKTPGRATQILAVEPDSAACLWKSLAADKLTTVPTRKTIMAGMNCGTLSTTAWPVLRNGVDASVTVSDAEAHEAVGNLREVGVSAGPCGAAPLAALKHISRSHSDIFKLDKDSVVVVLCTEGPREYDVPMDVSIEDPVMLTQALIRIDSTNPGLSRAGGAGELEIATYITAWLEHRGIETHWLEKTAGRPSVVGVSRGTGGGKSLLLTGHIDTVTTAGYDGNPLSGDIRDGSVFGRGAYDMKAGIAASLVALATAKVSKLSGDVMIAAVADEEDVSIGTEEVLEAGWRADGAIVSEPTNLDVTLAHKGFTWLYVDIIGRSAHGSRPDLGIDAICKAGHFLVELDKYSQDILKGPGHPILGTGSIHASLIQGGEELTSYPAVCTISIERRTVPGETPDIVVAEIRRILDRLTKTMPNFKYETRIGMSRNPFHISKDEPFVSGALQNIEHALGMPATLRPERFWTDCALLAEAEIPALLFGVDGGGAHAATEWATVNSIRKVTRALTLTALDFCK
ncbi:hypothetical protein VE02_05837 [Pseudogymnoascus sp. 03VT05]|nr:hypothetical protein VE02_05837 [Pseudogymnoascus sp. 03VT05]